MLSLLNSIVWKYTYELLKKEIENCQENICLVEAAFLIESGRVSEFNEVIKYLINNYQLLIKALN